MEHWTDALLERLHRMEPCIRIVVADIAGSTPCASGTCMLVTAADTWGTIGGGHLEFDAIRRARKMLAGDQNVAHVDRIVLGTEIRQCCGGRVSLWWERYLPTEHGIVDACRSRLLDRGRLTLRSSEHGRLEDLEAPPAAGGGSPDADAHPTGSGASIRTDPGGNPCLVETVEWLPATLWLFGAGHVGRAIVHALEGLPFRIFWIDSRADQLPSASTSRVIAIPAEEPETTVTTAAPGSWFLVMTHDHALDFRIVSAVLNRKDARYLGLIGSRPKARRFRNQLRKLGLPEERIRQLTCPIGLPGLASKNPHAIAISTIAQLLIEQQSAPPHPSRPDDR